MPPKICLCVRDRSWPCSPLTRCCRHPFCSGRSLLNTMAGGHVALRSDYGAQIGKVIVKLVPAVPVTKFLSPLCLSIMLKHMAIPKCRPILPRVGPKKCRHQMPANRGRIFTFSRPEVPPHPGPRQGNSIF